MAKHNVIASEPACHCEEHSDEAIFSSAEGSLAMTSKFLYLLVLIVAITGIVRFGEPSFAQEDEDVAAPVPTGEDCTLKVRDAVAKKRVAFSNFINENFKNEKMASELLPKAIERYAEYRKEIFALVENYSEAPEPGINIGTEAPKKEACKRFASDELSIIREVLKNHIKYNAQAKKATRLVDKYKEINAQLSKLNFQFAQMFAYFDLMDAKLPCVTQKCVQK